jgi:hypothetical protein
MREYLKLDLTVSEIIGYKEDVLSDVGALPSGRQYKFFLLVLSFLILLVEGAWSPTGSTRHGGH